MILKIIIVINESYRLNLNTAEPSVPTAKHGIVIFEATYWTKKLNTDHNKSRYFFTLFKTID
jgi:hypothetical protein